ncbi:MAG TPA: family 1 encapsulin nanocompartment shell protein [Treponemataceae bacterium]|nr:family 1 encapsulin nanocompartment shell protein [Treponemataceae bacterium]
MNMLRTGFAPISPAAWGEINALVTETLTANLAARKFCDVSGPHGINFAAVPEGRIEVPANQKKDEVRFGVHRVLPLVESRVSFSVNIWELDNIDRGAKDADLDSVVEAAQKIAAFEDGAVFNGFKPAGIVGLNDAVKAEKPVTLTLDRDTLVDGISEGLLRLRKEGIGGGANLVVNPVLWKFLAHVVPGGSLASIVRKQIGGKIIYSEAVNGALLVADRQGDLELSIGQDFAIGYEGHDSQKVDLFITESFTFRVIAPEAVVPFTVKA